MYFFTATINSWKHLFDSDDLKIIITDSLKWFNKNNRSAISGFVVMPNHVHILWQPLIPSSDLKDMNPNHSVEEFQIAEAANERDFLSFSGHQFKKKLMQLNPTQLEEYRSTQNNKDFHFWERRSRSIEVLSRAIAEQKLEYIHHNLCQPKWNLSKKPVEYKFSSAKFYETNVNDFGWLTHYYEFT